MLRIVFRYKDSMSRKHDDNWREQVAVCSSVSKAIEFYGLHEPDVEYQIVSVEGVSNE